MARKEKVEIQERLVLLRVTKKRAIFRMSEPELSRGITAPRGGFAYGFLPGPEPEVETKVRISRKKWVELGRPAFIDMKVRAS